MQSMPNKPARGADWDAWGDTIDTNMRSVASDLPAVQSAVTALTQRVTTAENSIAGKASLSELASIATSGQYADLLGAPSDTVAVRRDLSPVAAEPSLWPVTYWWTDYYSTTSQWNTILQAGPGLVIINPSSGFGTYNTDWLEQARRAKAAGATVIGYVLTGWASRDQAAVKAEVAQYVQSYQADGVFLDEAVNGWAAQAGQETYYQQLTDYFHGLYGSEFLVVSNPGANTTDAMLTGGDVLMTFEHDAAAYLASNEVVAPSSAYMKAPKTQFWHCVYNVTTPDLARQVLTRFDRAHASRLYLTDRTLDSNPYAAPPSKWLLDMQIAYCRGGLPATRSTGAGTDVTIRQNPDGTWPTITRQSGAHYRWLCIVNPTVQPTTANGAAPGDELVRPDSTAIL